jgi:hypothetical protein
MVSYAEMPDDMTGITVNPSSAKMYEDVLSSFYSSDGEYALLYMKDLSNMALFWYMDRDVTITGTHTRDIGMGETRTQTFNCSLKKGWNYVFASYNSATKTETITTGAAPSGYKWQVINIH